MPAPAAARFEFRPSMGFVALSVLSPLVLAGLGTWGLTRAGELRIIPLLLLLAGAGLALVGALDVPFCIVLDERGVHRRCALRRHLLRWDDLAALSRPSPRRGRRRPDLIGPDEDVVAGASPSTGRGGLLAETIDRRRYLLSAGQERPDIYAAVKEAVDRHAPGLSMPGPPFYAKSDKPL